MKVTEHEMRGLLTGKCVPVDILVNEELPAYLVRKFAELHSDIKKQETVYAQAVDSILLALKDKELVQDRLEDTEDKLQESREKLDAMGHECGKMLGLLNDICRYHEECTHDDMMHALIPLEYVSAINTFVERDVDGENPFAATDAFLNEVRAEGVEMFAKESEGLRKLHFERGDKEMAINADSRAMMARLFADPLRAGSTEGGV